MTEKSYLPANTILFCAPDDEPGQEQAKEFARHHKFEREQVRIARNDDRVQVIAKIPVEMPVVRLSEEPFLTTTKGE